LRRQRLRLLGLHLKPGDKFRHLGGQQSDFDGVIRSRWALWPLRSGGSGAARSPALPARTRRT
jgi:hypothetical protein